MDEYFIGFTANFLDSSKDNYVLSNWFSNINIYGEIVDNLSNTFYTIVDVSNKMAYHKRLSNINIGLFS